MTVLIIVLAIIFLILLLPVGAVVEYSEEGLFAAAKAGPVNIQILPNNKTEKDQKKKVKKKKNENNKEEKPKKGGSFELVKKMLPELLDTLSSVKRKIRIDMLTVHFVSASESPYAAAMNFGYASASIGMILPLLENNFVIKNRELTTDVSFTDTKPTIYIKAQITITVLSILMIVFGHGFKLLKIYSDFNKKRKVEQ